MLVIIGGTSGSVLFHPVWGCCFLKLSSLSSTSFLWFFFFSSIFEALPLDIFFLPVCWIPNLLLRPTLLIIRFSDDLCNPCCFWREMLLCFIIHGCITLEVVIANFYPSQAPSWCSNHLQCLDTIGASVLPTLSSRGQKRRINPSLSLIP